jgi:8-oxo-dGTP diphosphatase
MLINADPRLLEESGADGVHLDSARLMAARSRPVPADAWLAASCHDARELHQAARVGVDFAVLSPVAATESHPQAPPMGWLHFQRLVENVNLPVYAQGGMQPADLDAAWRHGGQGIAAVRALWKGEVVAGEGPPRISP